MHSHLALLVLSTAFASTSVGHPVPTRVAAGAGLAFTFAELPVHSLTIDKCNSTTETVMVQQTIDLIAGDTLTLPDGDVCGVLVHPSGRLHVQGTGTSGGTMSLSLAVGTIDLLVDPQIDVDNDTSDADWMRFAGTDWVTAAALALGPGVHVHVSPGHALHNSLRDAVEDDGEVEQ